MAWIGLGAGASALITILGFRIIGEITGAEAFGRASLLYGVGLLASGIVAGPVSQALTRLYFDFEAGLDRNRLWTAGLTLVALGATASLAVLCVAILSGAFGIALSAGSIVALATGLACEMLITLSRGWLNAQSQFSLLGGSQILQASLRPAFAVLLTGAMPDLTSLILLSYAVSAAVTAGILMFRITKEQRLARPGARATTAILRFGYPLIGNALFGWIGNAGDRYLVAGAISVEAAGVYIAASALGGRLSLMLGDVVETYYRPKVYEIVSGGDLSALHRTCLAWARWILMLGTATLGILVLGMPAIVTYLLAPEFRSGAPTVIIASYIAWWIIALSYIPQRINYAFDRTWFVTVVELGGMTAMFILVTGLGSMYGLAGAVIGLALSAILRFSLAASFAMYAAAHRREPGAPNYRPSAPSV